jgi:osmotically-inducible protein OsmY
MYPKKDNTLSLLGGAVLGAVAMYLLDPEAGERRRREIAETTGDAAGRVGDTLSPVWDRVADTAKTFGAGVAGGAAALGHGISEKYEDVRDSRTTRRLGRNVSDFGESVADKFRYAGRGARSMAAAPASWFREEEEESHAGAYAATGIGTLLLGAAAMYLLDPQRGAGRRSRVVDQATSVVNRTGRTFRRVGTDLRNRATGAAHQARSYVETEDAVSAEQLLQRVRSEMGHVVSHAGAIQVMTDNHGRVTLHGKVLASEADKLLSTVKGVGGVNEVINLLSVKDTEQQMGEGQAGAAGTSAVPQL